MSAAPRRPVPASLRHDQGNLRVLLDLLGLLHQVDVEARSHVPGDVAVEGPDLGKEKGDQRLSLYM